MPAEWEPHQRTWMIWPCREATFHGHFGGAKVDVATVAQAIAQFEPVTLLARAADRAEAVAACGPSVTVKTFALSDSWARDTGPTFVRNPKNDALAGVNWHFNAYGGLALQPDGTSPPHDEFRDDIALAARMLEEADVPRLDASLVLEGGSIHVDGEGTLLTTEQCLLSRNPDKSKADFAAIFEKFLGVRKVIWLGKGLQDDETNGHVDNLACFVAPGVVMALICNDPTDPNFAPLQDNLRRLLQAKDAHGRDLKVICIEQPPAAFRQNGERLSRSYLNFYLPNDGVVLPAFGSPTHDQAALDILRRNFPRRRVVQVPITHLIHGGGGIHCITQQQPQGRGAKGLKG
jgi:agmatine deiminase